MTLSTLVVILVTSVFLTQNNFYADAIRRSATQASVRTVTDLVLSETRNAALGGVIVAEATRFVFRTPVAIGLICNVAGANYDLHVADGASAPFSGTDVSGFAMFTATSTWNYNDLAWATMFVSSGSTSAAACEANGADTVAATAQFVRLTGLAAATPAPALGSAVMLYHAREFLIQTSVLDPTRLGMFTGEWGGALTEFATGMSAASGFSYRSGTDSYAVPVTGIGPLANIDGIRLVAEAVVDGMTGQQVTFTYGWTVDVLFLNSR